MRAAALLPAVVAVLVSSCGAAPITLVDSTGKLAAARDLISCGARCGERAAVVAAVGSKGTRKNALLNAAFGTEFQTKGGLKAGSAAAIAASSPGTVVVNCDGVTSDSEAKLAALSTAVSDVVVLNMYSSDVGRSVAANTRALKSIFTQKLASSEAVAEGEASQPLPLLVAVHDCDAGADGEALAAAVTADIAAVWEEMGSSAALSEHFTVQLVPVPHPHYQAEAYSRAVDSLRAKIAAALPEQLPLSATFATRAANGWTTVRKAPPPAPGRAELVPVYMVENAHADGAAQAEAALRAWQASVGKGRAVSGFGAKASELQRSVLSRYDADTISYSTTPLRAQRRAELVAVLESGTERLFHQQIKMLTSSALRSYKRDLLALLNSDKLSEEEEATLLRKVLFDFESKATELLPDAMQSLSFENEYEELEGELCDFSERFGDSPAAQARALAKVEKAVTKPKTAGKKGKRSISAGLGLVAYMRRAGQGGLQAFGGYKRGPHTVTFGYSDDASTPEAMQGDGQPPPLLRLQPKLNLDIDL